MFETIQNGMKRTMNELNSFKDWSLGKKLLVLGAVVLVAFYLLGKNEAKA